MPKQKSKSRGGATTAVAEKILTVILEACRKGDTARLKSLARRGMRVVTFEPLFQAVSDGTHLDVLRVLVKDLGADVNQDTKGHTPLSIAVKHRRLNMVRFLVTELGADVNQAMQLGEEHTPMSIAVQQGDIDMVRCFVLD
jgi:ankyrin repeat protein